MRKRAALIGLLTASLLLLMPACGTGRSGGNGGGNGPDVDDNGVVTITAGDQDNLVIDPTGGGTVAFASGPATAPMGDGSLRMSVGANGADGVDVYIPDFDGVALADLEELSYSTYRDVDGAGGQMPYVLLFIDVDNDGDWNLDEGDDALFFEPVYQDGTYPGDTVPDQGDLVDDTWQSWTATDGGWWSFQVGDFGPPIQLLSTYIAAHPDAHLIAPEEGLGAIDISVGFGAGAWDDFVGYIDEVIITIAGEDAITYDFEPGS